MNNYADRLISAIQEKGNACIVGLDPRLDLIPSFLSSRQYATEEEAIERAISDFHEIILNVVAPLVPGVKLQIAFYEQYGLAGLLAFERTIRAARERQLVVVVDAKRNDIASTAEAYASAFLGRANVFGKKRAAFDVDCITVSPFLGRDSLIAFVQACADYGKGIFVLVKTSNPGSVDMQDQYLKTTGRPLYEYLATMVDDLAKGVMGASGYSSIGAVVGATFPEEARLLRKLMPYSIFLVPGYGAQGGSAKDSVMCFNDDDLGAVINASRSITYAHRSPDIAKEEFCELVRFKTSEMVSEIAAELRLRKMH